MRKTLVLTGIILVLLIILNRIPFYKYKYFRNSSTQTIYSIEEVSPNIDSLLLYCNERLNHFDLPTPKSKIFLTQNIEEFCIFSFYVHRKAFAITKPLKKRIFIAPSEIAENYIYASSGIRRQFSGVLIHELTHLSLNKKYGLIKTIVEPSWKIEGICDFISDESSFDVLAGIEIFKNEINNENRSYKYFTYRLCIDYLVNKKGLTIDEIIDSKFNYGELQSEIRSKLKIGDYKPLDI
jgi:hypothetical protein